MRIPGTLIVPKRSGNPPSAVEGQVFFDTAVKRFKGHDGTRWVGLGMKIVTVQFATIAQAVAGTTQLVAAPGAGLKVKLLSYEFTLSAAGTAKFVSGASDLTGAFDIAANGGISAQGTPEAHLLEGAANTALSIVTTGGAARGKISYFVEA